MKAKPRSYVLLLPTFCFLLCPFTQAAVTITTHAGGGVANAHNVPATNVVLNGPQGLAPDARATSSMPRGALRVTTTLLGNGLLRLTWPGPNAGVLETSTNLAPNSWSPAGAPTQQPDGNWRLDVPPTEPMRFYRLKAQ